MKYTDNHSPNFCNPSLLIIGDGKSKEIKIDITLFPFRLDENHLPVDVAQATFNPIEGKVSLKDTILTIEFDRVLKEKERCAVRLFFLFEGL